MLGSLRSFFLWTPPEAAVRLVKSEKVSELKRQYSSCSSNDILTSQLLINSGLEYGYMSINLRDRNLGPCKSHAGNYVHRVHLHQSDFCSPPGIRQAVTGPIFCGKGEAPSFWQSILLRHGLVSNWSNFFCQVLLPECSHVTHLPILPHPLPGFGLILIFKPSEEEQLAKQLKGLGKAEKRQTALYIIFNIYYIYIYYYILM